MTQPLQVEEAKSKEDVPGAVKEHVVQNQTHYTLELELNALDQAVVRTKLLVQMDHAKLVTFAKLLTPIIAIVLKNNAKAEKYF